MPATLRLGCRSGDFERGAMAFVNRSGQKALAARIADNQNPVDGGADRTRQAIVGTVIGNVDQALRRKLLAIFTGAVLYDDVVERDFSHGRLGAQMEPGPSQAFQCGSTA